MKKINKILSLIFVAVLVITSLTVVKNEEIKAYTVYNKLEIENMQLNKARIKSGSNDSNGKHVETYWQQDPLDTYDKLTDITFARTVFNAETAGDYTFQIHCKNESGSGSIGIKLYVNGTAYDINVSGSSYQTVNKTVPLEKGDNTIVLTWVNWGYFDYINYPSELKIVSQNTGDKYYAFEAELNEVLLAPTNGFHNAGASLYTAPIEYNSGDEEWQGSATFYVDAPSDTKSIDLEYYVTEYAGSNAQLAMSVNDSKEVKIDLSGTKINSKLTYSISTKLLEEAGFKAGKANKIKFRQASASGGKVGLYSIKLKADAVEVETPATVKANRYEAEGAYVISGAQVKKSESDAEIWSKGSYVGEFTPANITNPNQIDEYCSNIGYIQYHVKADKAGYYKVTLGYATEVYSMTVYVTSGYEWSKVNLTTTGVWSNVGEKFTYVYLKKGKNSIWVTGPATKDDWVNYDYIDVVFDEPAKIDMKNTVLFMDNEAAATNSKVVSDKEESKERKDKASDGEGEPEEKESSSLTSPATGSPKYIVIGIITFALVAAGIVCGKKIKKVNI